MPALSASDRHEILGVPVSLVDQTAAVETVAAWVREFRGKPGPSRYICACDVHSVMRAQDDDRHMRALKGADMIVADGTPLVWISRIRGEKRLARVPGPDLLTAICERSEEAGWSHYFYGGAEGVTASAMDRLVSRPCSAASPACSSLSGRKLVLMILIPTSRVAARWT
jgi:N-acetylglucosaminyldiphosphoundecaprenol N-acetyl-beta-D-mannosaminyltransferase